MKFSVSVKWIRFGGIFSYLPISFTSYASLLQEITGARRVISLLLYPAFSTYTALLSVLSAHYSLLGHMLWYTFPYILVIEISQWAFHGTALSQLRSYRCLKNTTLVRSSDVKVRSLLFRILSMDIALHPLVLFHLLYGYVVWLIYWALPIWLDIGGRRSTQRC